MVTARALDHAPALAKALGAHARVQLGLSDIDGGVATLRELTQVAARAHDDRAEAVAWTRLIAVVGFSQGKQGEGALTIPMAESAVLRADEPLDLRIALLYAEGSFLDGGPHPEDGQAKLGEALVLLEKAGADAPTSPFAEQHVDVLRELATSHLEAADIAGAVPIYQRAITAYQKLLGPDSPSEAYAWHNLSEALRRIARLPDAIEAAQTAVRIRSERLGDSPNTASSLVTLATALCAAKRWDEALALYDRALAIDRAQLKATDPQIPTALMGRGQALTHLDRKAKPAAHWTTPSSPSNRTARAPSTCPSRTITAPSSRAASANATPRSPTTRTPSRSSRRSVARPIPSWPTRSSRSRSARSPSAAPPPPCSPWPAPAASSSLAATTCSRISTKDARWSAAART